MLCRCSNGDVGVAFVVAVGVAVAAAAATTAAAAAVGGDVLVCWYC